LLIASLCGVAQSLVAQDPYIKVREPREWQEGKPFVVPAGRAVKITGVAWHPAGIRQILVNGTAATIEPDPPLTNFEHVLTADNQARTITIVIVPTNSQRFEAKYAMAPPEQPVADTSGRNVRPVVTPPTRQAGEGAQPGPVVRGTRSGSGFKKRGWIYGLGAVGGGVLAAMTTSSTAEVCTNTNGLQDCFDRTTTEASYRGAGIGIAAASVVVGILDYTLSSRSRRIASGGGDADSRATIHLSAAPSNGGARGALALVSLRF
jgi:hypothetical protein